MVLDLAGLLRALVEGGVRFSVCSLDHLIAMKEARGAAIDQADLERLREP